MKILIIKMFLVIFLLTNLSQAQDWIKDYEYIPIVSPGLHWSWIRDYSWAITEMRNAGVDVIRWEIEDYAKLQTLLGYGFKVIPSRTLGLNYIQYYTDAKYSVWEAEGTPLDLGEATLEHDPAKATSVIDGSRTVLKLLPDSVYRTFEMINGPYYTQDVIYYTSLDNKLDTILYSADYEMKLEWNRQVADTTLMYNPSTPICRLQVTQSYAETTDRLGCTYPIVDTLIMLSDLQPLNQWKTISKNYTLECDSCTHPPSSNNPPSQNHLIRKPGSPSDEAEGPRQGREYIQFKVIWLGNPNFLLSVDKVTISDERGRQLLVDEPVQSELKIKSQTDSLNGYNNFIAGWLGVDEPQSIDIFAPIKRVTEILDFDSDNIRPLWLAWMGKWAGAYDQFSNTFGAMGLSPWNEFKKRVGRANVIQDFYLYDYPYCTDCPDPVLPPDNEDYRNANIRIMAELNYKQAYELDPYFGASIQCGEVHHTQAYQRDVRRHEVLYNANLALMYGAKFIELWQYFPERGVDSCETGYTCKGIMIFDEDEGGAPEPTDKYYMLRDTLNPRLKGLFGKTLKKLTPTEQHLNIDASSYYNFISHFSGNLECLPTTSDYDLGFFTDSLSRDYFMIISRYYNQSGACPIYINFDESSLNNNLVLTKFAVDTTYNILRSDPIPVNLTRGDAELYRIYPVVRWGGQLLANDTIYTNTILTNNMLINSAKSVYIKPGMLYTIQDTITLQGSGSTITGEGYLEVAQGGEVIIYNWTNSLFKGKQSDHPKLFWGKFTGTGHTGYKIYRKKETLSFMEIASLSDSARTFTDTTVTIIEGQSQANEVEAEYYVKAIYNNGRSSSNSNTINYRRVEGSGQEKINTGLTRDNFTYQLQQNYPNPFNPVTQISYSIENDGLVELEVLNILGERVASLVNEHKTKGSYTIPFDASQLSSGIYIYRLRSKDFVSSKKMILLK